MPLNIVENPVENPAALLDRPEAFLIFYSNVEEGRMWCSDCRAVDEHVRKVFSESDTGPVAAIVYVGSKPVWKAKDHVFRGEPLKIGGVPTILKIREGKEVGRLVDKEINTQLEQFVSSD
ncbi:Duf953 domain protein [Favolaschia claudopus]|uniref:Duf953 domain protein n=1 Tax=Favolaschia claudopus TaxID=2862362 RepID=A0AAW0EIS5_9AGAR